MTPFAEGGPGYSRIGGEPRGSPAVPIIRYTPPTAKSPKARIFTLPNAGPTKPGHGTTKKGGDTLSIISRQRKFL